MTHYANNMFNISETIQPTPIHDQWTDEYFPSLEDREIIYKKLEPDTECIITMCKIDDNIKYSSCYMCNVVFQWDMINEWLTIHNSCPHCRTTLTTTLLPVYVNADNALSLVDVTTV